jgi:hypothetical protein
MPEDHITDLEMKSTPVHIGAQVPPELAAALKARAKHTDRSVASIIRMALLEHLYGDLTAAA